MYIFFTMPTEVVNERGKTVLFCALTSGMVQFLIDRNANVNHISNCRDSPFGPHLRIKIWKLCNQLFQWVQMPILSILVMVACWARLAAWGMARQCGCCWMEEPITCACLILYMVLHDVATRISLKFFMKRTAHWYSKPISRDIPYCMWQWMQNKWIALNFCLTKEQMILPAPIPIANKQYLNMLFVKAGLMELFWWLKVIQQKFLLCCTRAQVA